MRIGTQPARLVGALRLPVSVPLPVAEARSSASQLRRRRPVPPITGPPSCDSDPSRALIGPYPPPSLLSRRFHS